MTALKRYRLSFADALKHVPEHPERTARRSGTGLDMDVYFQVWPHRKAMLQTIEMQSRGPARPDHWRACKIPEGMVRVSEQLRTDDEAAP